MHVRGSSGLGRGPAFSKTQSNIVKSNTLNTRNGVSSDIQTLRSGLKKRGAAEFLTTFEVFGQLSLLASGINCLVFSGCLTVLFGQSGYKRFVIGQVKSDSLDPKLPIKP